jgi:hypothetical protein
VPTVEEVARALQTTSLRDTPDQLFATPRSGLTWLVPENRYRPQAAAAAGRDIVTPFAVAAAAAAAAGTTTATRRSIAASSNCDDDIDDK